ncbi:MAG: HD domain-containing protein [Candidatus Omnitrophota bacterium]|nr:HD domain-containing protein [Candidatus Omnitrophota bacterium]
MKKQPNSYEKLLSFVVEAGMLKRVQRSGWSVVGVQDAESVAEHSFRCAIIGYILACMEGVGAYKILLMTIFNDIQEARTTDLHKMAQRYIKIEKGEEQAFHEQVRYLPKNINKELMAMRKEYFAQGTKESIIARDADILECLIQAKEYYEHGFREAIKFTKEAPRFLKTKSAKKLWALAKRNNMCDWWLKLSDFKR